MRNILAACVFALLLPVGLSAQTNPCTSPSDTLVLTPATNISLFAELPDHNTMVLGGATPLTGSYELRYFFEGATAPFTVAPIAKSAFVLVAGTTMCYTAQVTWPTPLVVNQRYRSVLIAKATPSLGLTDSAPSALSNPFGKPAGSPLVPPVVRIGPGQ